MDQHSLFKPCTVEKKESKKKFVLRIDSATMAAIEKWASDEFRSVNGHLEFIITRALQDSGRMKEPKKGLPEEK